jgi:cyclohexyl-isocyanide hydratase
VITSPNPLQIGMLLYPGLTMLDLIGPQAAFHMHGQTHLAWKTLDPVPSDSGVAILPTTTFADCPLDLDVLFVPGGLGTAEVLEDAESLRFLAERAPRARYVTSVCSGSIILAAAGLLKGYRASTHWSAYEVLAAFGVDVSDERVVIDRNRITAGGVTAGIDFGLTVIAQLRNDTLAQLTQLALEYDPAPPYDAGTPRTAAPEIVEMARNVVADVNARCLAIAAAWRERERLAG